MACVRRSACRLRVAEYPQPAPQNLGASVPLHDDVGSHRDMCVARSLEPGARRGLGDFRPGGPCSEVRLTPDDDPVRALLLVPIEPLAVVAADALGLDDLRTVDRAPVAGLLAQLARVALGPSLYAEDRHLREQAERRAE